MSPRIKALHVTVQTCREVDNDPYGRITQTISCEKTTGTTGHSITHDATSHRMRLMHGS